MFKFISIKETIVGNGNNVFIFLILCVKILCAMCMHVVMHYCISLTGLGRRWHKAVKHEEIYPTIVFTNIVSDIDIEISNNDIEYRRFS